MNLKKPSPPEATAAKPKDSTRSKIVMAALRVFAARGFEAASLKEITTASETNVAAIHYHFGSKEALIREVLQTVADPVNQLRMEMLERQPAGPGRTLEHVLEALLAPPIRLSADATGDGRLLTRLILQARALPSEFTSTALFQQYDSMALHFVQALRDAEPGLSEADAFWRYAFAIGAMHYIVADSDAANHRLNRLSGGLCDTDDPEAILRQLIAFVVAGMRARPASTPSPSP